MKYTFGKNSLNLDGIYTQGLDCADKASCTGTWVNKIEVNGDSFEEVKLIAEVLLGCLDDLETISDD